MKEHPILFSGPMVQAILAGRKTQTRRICKPQPYSVGDQFSTRQHGTLMIKNAGEENWSEKPCPYGKIGDRLWVRESFTPCTGGGNHCKIIDASYVCFRDGDQKFRNGNMFDWDSNGEPKFDKANPFSPSIHMPRWASRITLEITGIRVERLIEISRGDCMAEGCPFQNIANDTDDPVEWYLALWNSINGPDSWSQNPFVWVIEFKRVEQ